MNTPADMMSTPTKVNHPSTASATQQPWLSPLSNQLLSEVQGFASFLRNRLNKFPAHSPAAFEITHKLNQLYNWSNIASKLLMDPNEKDPSPEDPSGIDGFQLEAEKFELLSANYLDRVVKVLVPTDQHSINAYAQDSRNARVCTENNPRGGDDETKDFEEMNFNSNSFNVQEEDESESRFESSSEVVKGYIFMKCLRRVNTPTESRDIYRSVMCTVNVATRRVITLFDKSHGDYHDTTYIIKRVSKVIAQDPNNPSMVSKCNMINNRFNREFKVQTLLTGIQHPNINPILHYFEDEHNMFSVSTSAGSMDLLDMLASHVESFKKGFEETPVRRIFAGAVEGLLVAHNLGIAHRDISLENLVLNQSKELEIIDWGHSARVGHTVAVREMKYEGPIGKEKYMSPELVSREPTTKEVDCYDPFKADVFALGVCIYGCLLGEMPFESARKGYPPSLAEKMNVASRARNVELSREAVDLLSKMLAKDPKERIEMGDVLDHAFFKGDW